MAGNLARHVTALQLGDTPTRHHRSRRLQAVLPVTANAPRVDLQRSSIRRILLPSLRCPPRNVLTLHDTSTSDALSAPVPAFQVAFGHQRGPGAHLLAAVDEEGAVAVWDAAGARRQRWAAHRNAIFDVIWSQDDRHVLTASGDRLIRGWDVAGQTNVPLFTLRGHDMSVKSVRQAPDNAHVFASGARDGRVLLWDTRACGKPVTSLHDVHADPPSWSARSGRASVQASTARNKRRRVGTGSTAAASTSTTPRSVTCVEFGASVHEVVTAGATDAVVKFWDVRWLRADGNNKRKSVSSRGFAATREVSCASRRDKQRGISSLSFSTTLGIPRLLVNVLNDTMAIVDVGSQQPKPVMRCTGHCTSSFYSKAAFSPDGDFILGASADGVAYVWDVTATSSKDPRSCTESDAADVAVRGPCLALKGHASELNGVAWSSHDFTRLASCSDDGTVRCWQLQGRHQQASSHGDRATFELLQTPVAKDGEERKRARWTNWDAFVEQPNGFAYPVRRADKAEEVVVCCASQHGRVRDDRMAPTGSRPSWEEDLRGGEVREQPAVELEPRREEEPRGTAPRSTQRTLFDLWGR